MGIQIIFMKHLFYLAFLFLGVNAFGQSLSGQVISEDGLTLPGAVIRLQDTDLGAVTDVNGEYRIFNIPSGTYTVTVDYIGFNSISETISIDGNLVKDFTLVAGIELDEVVVVGQNLQGISRALNKQKTNDNITNVVSADQMGRFPDSNIGDAMKRIPGVTMQNDQGEARDIYIRGIAKQYNSVTLNGDRLPSAEGDNRNIQMDLIPADMIQLVEVNKAVLPEMDADAIGGSVNLVTRAATKEPRISATLAPGYAPIREKANWTGALIAGKRFANDKLGVVFTGTYDRKDYGSDNFEAEYDETNIVDFQIRKYDVIRKRLSGGLDLDYKLNDKHKIAVKSLFSDRKDYENRFRLRYKDIENGEAEIRRQTKGGINNNEVKNTRLEHQKLGNVSLNGNHIFGTKGIEFDWSGSYSNASETRPNERYLSYRLKGQAVNISGVDTKSPFVSAVEAFDASSYEIKEAAEVFQSTDENNYKGKFKVKIPLAEGINKSNVKLGYTYKNKEKKRNNSAKDYTDSVEAVYENLSSTKLHKQQFYKFKFGSQYNPGTFAEREFLGNLDFENQFAGKDNKAEYIPVNYAAEESVHAGFAQYKQHLGEKFSFVLGMRVEATNTEYQGNKYDEAKDEITILRGNSEYSNFLPGAHLSYKPVENSVVRLAWTNTIARPNYYDLSPYRFINEDNEAEFGNPLLNPVESMNIDLTGEQYFESIGLISLGGFYKNIDNFFYTFVKNDYTYEGVTYDKFKQTRNGDVASVYGVEAAVQRQLDFLPGVLSRFNAYANYTYTGSKAKIAERGNEELDLPGTAPSLINLSLSYEDKNFNSRLSYNHTASYVDEYAEKAFEDVYYDKQTFVDFNANYFIKNQWTIFLEAKNLTNQPLRYYQGVKNRTYQVEYYKPSYNLGVKFNF